MDQNTLRIFRLVVLLYLGRPDLNKRAGRQSRADGAPNDEKRQTGSLQNLQKPLS